ncbi:MAG TPA: Gfo/Idh/MocA family oxidoreductase, partial [Dermatophilaceae bacterium]|nr:Gfo/Idh/MocA family oxidoreductase [Dermatophilaceae bacterium]
MSADPAPVNLRDHPGRPLERALRVAIVGGGARGSTYARHLDESAGKAVVGAIAEPREAIRRATGARYVIPQGSRFEDWRDMVAAPRSCDAVIISLQDSEHLAAATAFAAAGYDILLEKPMAPTLAECRRIVAATEKANVWLGVCHVLRYTPYTSLVRSLIEGGAIGDIVNVHHLEPVGFWHFAHSYVRGSWSREATSAPVLLTKSSHDIDWLSYVIGRPATRVSSFGSLLHFRPEHAPEGAAERCLDCAVEDACAYSAVRIYRKGLAPGLRESSFTEVVAPEYTGEALTAALRDGPYGRCVYG